MKVPVRWLNDYVKVEDVSIEKLAESFLSIGFEVEEIVNPVQNYKNIVTGRVLNLEKHPNADNLSIVSIDVGLSVSVTIVTGAKNVSLNDVVPVALDGAVIAGGKKIMRTDFRGILSEGMLCSGKELDIDDNIIEGAEVDGILILPKNTPVGICIATALDIDEYIFDIAVNSNRPDCNSVLGLSKEIAVKLGREIKMPQLTYKTVNDSKKIPDVVIENTSLCSRYYGNVIFDVKIEKSPAWMRKRLISAGVRPINNIVDITNYVLLEIGQPLHAFDFDKIEGSICVRTAQKGEALLALNDIEYKLDENMLVIADKKKPLAIAGVMGGKYSAIDSATNAVFLEAARFAKASVRYTSRAVGLRSESSARFERGVDYASVDMGRSRALCLIDSLGAGRILGLTSYSEMQAPARKSIRTSYEQINSILGINVPGKEIKRILENLGFELINKGSAKEFECIVPIHREDIDNFTDLSEEVIRFYGYDNIISTNMENASLTRGEIPLAVSNIRKVKNVLCGAGLYEIINFSFIGASDTEKLNLAKDDASRRQIKIINPLGEDRAYMRTQLMSSMIKTLQLNQSRQNNNIGMFEISKVFIPAELPLKELPYEPYFLCIGLLGKQFDFYYLKNIVTNLLQAFSLKFSIKRSDNSRFHPGISADIILDGKNIGSFGKLHPLVSKNFETSEDIYVLEINLEDIISRTEHITKVSPLPKYPAVDRDLAVVVKSDISAGDLINIIKTAAKGYLESADLFDVYVGGQIEDGHKSMAFSLRFRSGEKTLQDSDIQSLMSAIIDSLKKSFGVKLR